MQEKNRSHVYGNNESSSIVITNETSGSHHDPNPKTRKQRSSSGSHLHHRDDEEAPQTLALEPDRLSELPDSLILSILSLLPSSNQVIQTSTLSKRWRHLWTFSPNFLLTHVTTDVVLSPTACENFASSVTKTLAHSRVSKIDKFSILIPYLALLAPHVDSWLRFVAKNNADHVTLNFIHMIHGEDYVLSPGFYANSSIKVLELMNCEVAPVGVVSWKSLTRLCLKYVRLSDVVMEGILLGCPALEVLEVRNYCGFHRLEVVSLSLREFILSHFEHPFDKDNEDDEEEYDDEDAYLAISAPNLRVLMISSRFYASNVRLEDVKSLVVADLSFHLGTDDGGGDFDKCRDLLQELLATLHHVEELKLANWCIEVLAELEPSKLLNCKRLILDMGDGDLPEIAKLLNFSPNLETLVISTETMSPSEPPLGGMRYGYFVGGEDYFQLLTVGAEDYTKLQKMHPECSLLHLKKVKIFGLRRVCEAVELVQFLLKNAKVLEIMNIYLQREDFQCLSECCVGHWQERVHKEVYLSASSPHAVIRFFRFGEEFMPIGMLCVASKNRVLSWKRL